MNIVLTGANGFLAWHVRARMQALTEHNVQCVSRRNWNDLPTLVRDADAVIHIAGVNRGSASEVEEGNVRLAANLADTIRAANSNPTIVFTNSIQCGNGTPYGSGKAAAADALATVSQQQGLSFVDIKLPNLFGEHGRPMYNSFVATFADTVIKGGQPNIIDRPVTLMHAQRAAQIILDQVLAPQQNFRQPEGQSTSIREVFEVLRLQNDLYSTGDIPDLSNDLDVDLFNTLRTARFPAHYPIPLTSRTDHRGRLVEVTRAHGGQGQTFVSTTKPGVTRGEHFHLRKIERFVVLAGQARISLRRLFTNEVINFDVTGANPTVVDMPTMWVHNLTNTGTSELTTLFWAHELFNPDHPDTFADRVDPGSEMNVA